MSTVLKKFLALWLALAVALPLAAVEAAGTAAASAEEQSNETYLRQAEKRYADARSGRANFVIDFDCSMGRLDGEIETTFVLAEADSSDDASHVRIAGTARAVFQLPLTQPQSVTYPFFIAADKATVDFYAYDADKGKWVHYRQTVADVDDKVATVKDEAARLAAPAQNKPAVPRTVTLAGQTDATKTFDVTLDTREFFKAVNEATKDMKNGKKLKLDLKTPALQSFTYTAEVDRPTQTIARQSFDLTELLRAIGQQLVRNDKTIKAEDRKLIGEFINNATLKLTLTAKDLNEPLTVEIPPEALAAPAEPLVKKGKPAKS